MSSFSSYKPTPTFSANLADPIGMSVLSYLEKNKVYRTVHCFANHTAEPGDIAIFAIQRNTGNRLLSNGFLTVAAHHISDDLTPKWARSTVLRIGVMTPLISGGKSRHSYNITKLQNAIRTAAIGYHQWFREEIECPWGIPPLFRDRDKYDRWQLIARKQRQIAIDSAIPV